MVQALHSDLDRVFSYLRGRFSPEAVFTRALEYLQGEASHFFVTYKYGNGPGLRTDNDPEDSTQRLRLRPLSRPRSGLGMGVGSKAFDQTALPVAAQEAFAEIREWHRSRLWFLERGIPWKRGYLLTGLPGTGKTLLRSGCGGASRRPHVRFRPSQLRQCPAS